MLRRRISGWFRSACSSHEMSVVMWKTDSKAGRSAPASIVVTIPQRRGAASRSISLPVPKAMSDLAEEHHVKRGGEPRVEAAREQAAAPAHALAGEDGNESNAQSGGDERQREAVLHQGGAQKRGIDGGVESEPPAGEHAEDGRGQRMRCQHEGETRTPLAMLSITQHQAGDREMHADHREGEDDLAVVAALILKPEIPVDRGGDEHRGDEDRAAGRGCVQACGQHTKKNQQTQPRSRQGAHADKRIAAQRLPHFTLQLFAADSAA